MANATGSYNAEFQQTQSQLQPQARQMVQSFIPGSAIVSDVLDMLGYEMSTTLQERINKSRKISRKRRNTDQRNKNEQARRDDMRIQSKKLSDAVAGPGTSKATLKECLESAFNCIKKLKFDSSMLLAERYWLILENRELSERLQELQDGCGIHSIPKLWEDGVTMDHCLYTQWDKVTEVKSSDQMDVYEREKYFNHCLENVRKQKMQLHEDYKRSRDDAAPGKMEIGGWCADRGCAAAPHRIHDGAWLEGSDSLWTPPLSLEEENRYEDGGWLEDMSSKCPGKHPVTLDKSRTAPTRKIKHFPAGKEMKGKMRNESKSGSGAFTLNAVKQNPSSHLNMHLIPLTPGNAVLVYQPEKLVSGSTSAQAPVTNVQPLVVPVSSGTTYVDPSTGNRQVRFKMVSASPSVRLSQPTVIKAKPQGALGSINTCSLNPSKGNGQGYFKLVPLAPSVGNSHPEVTKDQFRATHGSLGVLGLDPSKAPVASSVGHSQPMVMKDQFRATHGSLGVLGLDPSKAPIASSVGLSQPTATKDQFLPAHGSLGVLGLDPSKVPIASSVGLSQPTATKDQFLAAHGSLGVFGLDPSKGNGQADVMTVSAQAKVSQSKVTASQQRVPGSVSLVKLDSKDVISKRFKLVPVPTGDRVSQPIGTKDKYQVVGGPVSMGNLYFKKRKVTADVKALSAHQHGVELGKHTSIKVTHPVLSEFKVAPEHANVGHSQPIMTQGGHRVNPGSIGATEESAADVTEEADRCSSPISCMLCETPPDLLECCVGQSSLYYHSAIGVCLGLGIH